MQADISSRSLRITGRRSSHFTRVAVIFADELGLQVEFNAIHDLKSFDTSVYGGHPGLKMPTLHLGSHESTGTGDDNWLAGTDNICRRLAELAGRADDPRVVLSHHLASDLLRNAQELVWNAMATQVQLVIGIRFAKLPADSVFFQKATLGMQGSLAWLDARLDALLGELHSPRDVSVFEVSLFCLLEHIVFCRTLPLDEFSNLRAFAATYGQRASSQRTVFRYESAASPAAIAPLPFVAK